MKRKTIAIIGAGISGLCLAWYLQKKMSGVVDLLIFEKEAKVGGVLQTREQGSFLFEQGPRTIRSKNALFFDLVKDLQIEDEVITSSQDASIRYLASDTGSLEMLPRTLGSLFFSSLGRTILKGVLRSLFVSHKEQKDLSVEEYFVRRFGRDFTARCIDPLTAGIFAATPQKLSMQSSFPNFRFIFQNKGSSVLYSFRKGMAFFPELIAKKLQAKLFLSCPVTSVIERDSKIELHTHVGRYEVDTLFCALGSEGLKDLFPELSPLCVQIPLAKVVSVSFGFLQDISLPKGFGFLCPSSVERALLGVIFDSNIFHPEKKGTLLSVMMGGARDPSLFELSDEQVIEKAKEWCRRYLRITNSYDEVLVTRASIPNYQVGHQDLVKKIEKGLKNVYLLGSGFYGVSVVDCIESAYKLANQYHVDEKQDLFLM